MVRLNTFPEPSTFQEITLFPMSPCLAFPEVAVHK
jgi:hypothetical protein